MLHARREGRPTVDNSAVYGFLRGLSWIKIWLLRPFSIVLFQRKLKVHKKSIRKQTRSLLKVAAHPSVVASTTQDGKFYNGAGISHWISSYHYLFQVFTPCSSHPTYETTPQLQSKPNSAQHLLNKFDLYKLARFLSNLKRVSGWHVGSCSDHTCVQGWLWECENPMHVHTGPHFWKAPRPKRVVC